MRRPRKRTGNSGVSTPRQPRFPRFAADTTAAETSKTREQPDIIEPEFTGGQQLTQEQIAAIKAKQGKAAPAGRQRNRR
jgi:hypothetical protein